MRESIVWPGLTLEPPDLFSRLQSYRWTSIIIALLLVMHAALFIWQLAIPSPMIDFFTFWSVPHAASVKHITNIYSPDHQREMASEMVAEAQGQGVSEVQMRATEGISQLYGNRLDATGSPFLYTLIGVLSSGDFESDQKRFLLIWVLCLAASVIVLCHLLQFSVVSTMLLLVFIGSNYSPVLSDLRVGNVNTIQLFAITLFILFTARSWPVLAGIAIGLATMIKPTTLVVLASIVLVGLADKDSRRVFRMLAGCCVAGIVSVAVSGIYFGNPVMWIDFIRSLPRTLGAGLYPLENGNFSLAALLFGGDGRSAAAILVVLFSGYSWLMFATRRTAPDTTAEGEKQRLLHYAFSAAGTGCALMLLSSPLAWLHYFILLIPLSLFAIRPIPGSAASQPARLLAFLPLLMFSALTESMMRGSALGESVMVNGAAVLTLVCATWQTWGQDRSTSAMPPKQTTQRTRR